MDFALELTPASGGGLGELRYGMTEDEAMTALDPWRQRPGPPGRAYRESGLSIGPSFGGANDGRGSVVCGISFAGPPDTTDRVLFDGLDLWGGSLAEVVARIRDRGHNVNQHGPERYVIDDTDVWLMLQRPERFASAEPHIVDLLVARPSLLGSPPSASRPSC
jgi:hypothetical protein